MAPASSTVEGPVETLDVPSAIASAAIGYGIVLPFAVYLNDYLAVQYPLADGVNGSMEKMHNIGWFILAYVAFLLVGRVVDAGWHNMYEMLWACNVAMVLAGYGIVTDRPRLVGATWVMISLDQTLWYIEIAFRIYRGKDHPRPWVIGVAKYLDAPETTRMKFWTAWHHLWFFPLILYTLQDHGYVPVGSYFFQVVLMTVLGITSRVLTPYQVYEPKISAAHVVYLNINLSHKFWKDIHTRSWGKVDRFFARGWECSSGLNGRPIDDFSHIYDNESGLVGSVKYLLWANLILNIVNILPTLVISIVLYAVR